MRILDARIHFILDVAFALAFALGPLVFGLGGSPAAVSFVIALVFVFLAASVWWRRRRREVATIAIPHGLVELAIAVLLAVLPRIDGYSPGSPARTFVWTMAIAVGLAWLLTAYGDTRATLRTAAEERAPRL